MIWACKNYLMYHIFISTVLNDVPLYFVLFVYEDFTANKFYFWVGFTYKFCCTMYIDNKELSIYGN